MEGKVQSQKYIHVDLQGLWKGPNVVPTSNSQQTKYFMPDKKTGIFFFALQSRYQEGIC